ncbi:hypothetical protein [Nostoc sp. UHCC 0252]|uniref:hypothetical protein n=1 Tax=Nostoc sp. UHCC 0252 TaxID=3110241 RepID=UPI002B215634|nr:hypothetical protein [Nostoc sp. UHCC 0252]MEA5604251.1 hypothetical protein [Nostoc sp. UHCC 0252]
MSTTGVAASPTMLNYNPLHCLPSAEDLPDSDYTPVDNELQDLIPSLLKAILAWLWTNGMDISLSLILAFTPGFRSVVFFTYF